MMEEEVQEATSINLTEPILYKHKGQPGLKESDYFSKRADNDIEEIVRSRRGFVIERAESPDIWVDPDIVKSCQLEEPEESS